MWIFLCYSTSSSSSSSASLSVFSLMKKKNKIFQRVFNTVDTSVDCIKCKLVLVCWFRKGIRCSRLEKCMTWVNLASSVFNRCYIVGLHFCLQRYWNEFWNQGSTSTVKNCGCEWICESKKHGRKCRYLREWCNY